MPERWSEVACEVADIIRQHPCVKPSASRTQLEGPGAEVYTEWSAVYPSGREVPVLRETRYPGEYRGDPDRLPCEHHVPTRAALVAAKGNDEEGLG